MKHPNFTPGPWVKLPESMTIRARGCVVGDVCRQSNGIGEANARLIAAATDMYEALEDCDNAFVSWQVGQIPGRSEDVLALIVKVRAALEKAGRA